MPKPTKSGHESQVHQGGYPASRDPQQPQQVGYRASQDPQQAGKRRLPSPVKKATHLDDWEKYQDWTAKIWDTRQHNTKLAVWTAIVLNSKALWGRVWTQPFHMEESKSFLHNNKVGDSIDLDDNKAGNLIDLGDDDDPSAPQASHKTIFNGKAAYDLASRIGLLFLAVLAYPIAALLQLFMTAYFLLERAVVHGTAVFTWRAAAKIDFDSNTNRDNMFVRDSNAKFQPYNNNDVYVGKVRPVGFTPSILLGLPAYSWRLAMYALFAALVAVAAAPFMYVPAAAVALGIGVSTTGFAVATGLGVFGLLNLVGSLRSIVFAQPWKLPKDTNGEWNMKFWRWQWRLNFNRINNMFMLMAASALMAPALALLSLAAPQMGGIAAASAFTWLANFAPAWLAMGSAKFFIVTLNIAMAPPLATVIGLLGFGLVASYAVAGFLRLLGESLKSSSGFIAKHTHKNVGDLAQFLGDWSGKLGDWLGRGILVAVLALVTNVLFATLKAVSTYGSAAFGKWQAGDKLAVWSARIGVGIIVVGSIVAFFRRKIADFSSSAYQATKDKFNSLFKDGSNSSGKGPNLTPGHLTSEESDSDDDENQNNDDPNFVGLDDVDNTKGYQHQADANAIKADLELVVPAPAGHSLNADPNDDVPELESNEDEDAKKRISPTLLDSAPEEGAATLTTPQTTPQTTEQPVVESIAEEDGSKMTDTSTVNVSPV